MHRVVRIVFVAFCVAAPGLALAQTAALSESQKLRRTPVVAVFQQCKDAVVNISSTQIVKVQAPSGFDSLFEDFFDLPGIRRQTREYKATSVGSGFVIHPAGYIVTNAHVVARTADRKAIFADKREHDAQIIAIDTHRDLAVLKIETDRPLPALRLGRSNDLMPGETVIAIGNPLGFTHTVTAGVISATDRSIEVANDVAFRGLIQTDASINPGNSGGPLLNALGELIGVNTAIRGDAQNIGFAIPVDQLREVLPEMLDVERRYRINTGLRLSRDGSPRVTSVDHQSPAHAAGIEVGDAIIAIAGQPVTNAIDFHISLIGRKPGEKLPVMLRRVAQDKSVTLTLAARPKPDGAKLLLSKLGLEAEAVGEKAARSLGMPQLRGLAVVSVEDKGPASRIGIKRADIIDGIGGYQVGSIDEVGELLERVEAGQPLQITVLRLSNHSVFRAQATLTAR